MTRRFRKHGWQHDSDCRLTLLPPKRPVLVVQPVLPDLEPHSLSAPARQYKHRAQKGAFRPSGSRRLVRWLTNFRRKMTLW